jgi:hypothetical protein
MPRRIWPGPPLGRPFIANPDSVQANGLWRWYPLVGGPLPRQLAVPSAAPSLAGNAVLSVAPPPFGFGAEFDGTGDYVDTGEFSLNGLTGFTISFWLYARTVATVSNGNGWVGQGTGGASNQSFWQHRRIFIRGATANQDTGNNTAALAVTAGQWTLMTLVRVNTGFTAYRDAVSVVTNSTTGGAVTAATVNNFTIGGVLSGTSNAAFYTDGWIADFRLYTRALSPAEVWQLYDPQTRGELFLPPRWQVMTAPPAGGATEALSGTSAGVSTASAALSATVALSGTSAGVSTASAALSATVALSGTSAGVSTASANLTVTAGATEALSGTSAGVSTASAALSATVALSGTSAGVSTASAALSSTVALSAAVAGASAASAALTVAGPPLALNPATDGMWGGIALWGIVGREWGELDASFAIAGASAGTSAASGAILVDAALSGSSAAVSAAIALLSSTVPLSGSSAAVSSASAVFSPEEAVRYYLTSAGEGAAYRTSTRGRVVAVSSNGRSESGYRIRPVRR